MKTLILMVGVPGSGKSYVANMLSEEHRAKVISRDTIRYRILDRDGETDYFARENEVFETFISEIRDSLLKNEITVADATHVDAASRRKVLKRLDLTDVNVVACVINTPLEVCLKRNSEREGRAKVPESAIKNLNEKCTLPTEAEGFNNICIVYNRGTN